MKTPPAADKPRLSPVIAMDAIGDQGLTPAEFRVFCGLVSYARPSVGDMTVWPADETLAKVCAMDARSVRRHLRSLETKRYIARRSTRTQGKWDRKITLTPPYQLRVAFEAIGQDRPLATDASVLCQGAGMIGGSHDHRTELTAGNGQKQPMATDTSDLWHRTGSSAGIGQDRPKKPTSEAYQGSQEPPCSPPGGTGNLPGIEGPTPKPKAPDGCSVVVDLWREICVPAGMPDVNPGAWGKSTKAKASKAAKDPDELRALFVRASKAPHLRGENDRRWKADLLWVLGTGRERIDAGRYDVAEPEEPEVTDPSHLPAPRLPIEPELTAEERIAQADRVAAFLASRRGLGSMIGR